MSKRTCPFDDSYSIETCPSKECPYSHSRTKDLFIYENPKTRCCLLDIPGLLDILHSRAPWTAAAKSNILHPSVSLRSIRRQIELTSLVAKTVVYITTEVSADSCCSICGYSKCSGGKYCVDRDLWVRQVIEKLNCPNTLSVRSNIWKLLTDGRLEINDAVMLRAGKRLLDDGHNNP